VIAGLHNASSGYALKMVSQGWQFVTLASDSRFLAARASEEVANVKQTGSCLRTRASSLAPRASA
jgi:4-hydroxy-2-oxoheptanedioate aldolase